MSSSTAKQSPKSTKAPNTKPAPDAPSESGERPTEDLSKAQERAYKRWNEATSIGHRAEMIDRLSRKISTIARSVRKLESAVAPLVPGRVTQDEQTVARYNLTFAKDDLFDAMVLVDDLRTWERESADMLAPDDLDSGNTHPIGRLGKVIEQRYRSHDRAVQAEKAAVKS